MKIIVTNLGFAAYLKVLSEDGRGVKFLAVEDKSFIFESDRDEKSLRVDYYNSKCSRHDRCVMELRELMS